MGLLSFIKDAGAKIFGGETSADSEARKEKAIVDFVNQFGLQIQDLEVAVNNDTATVRGITESQAEKEKVLLAVGNIQGIATVNDLIEVQVPEPEAIYYTVQKGDSLSKIAKNQYGDAMKYPVIFEANKPMLKNPDLIYPGQVLRIPPLEQKSGS